jgi:fused signal recognition particle receptor
MELYPEPYRRRLYTLLDRAGMSVVTDPQTGPLHVPVDELLDAGIPVALGQDDIADAYYPFGRNSLIEVGFLAAHLLWKSTAADLADIHAMLTRHGAGSLGLDDHGLETGAPANLVLLEADVAQEVAHELRDEMEKRLPRIRVDSKSEVPKAVEDELKSAIRDLLEGQSFQFDEWLLTEDERPLTVMFVGVNGTGKTTTIARIAHRMKELGFSSVLAAGDTYRAGAIEQLKEHGEKLGVRVIHHEPGSDAAAVAYDAIDHAEARKKDLVLVDTAGRMQTDSNLMDELAKIESVADPDLTVFVGDSLAGNDAIEQAKEFDEAVGVDASVLTKVDTDAKGGAALSIAHAVGKPVAYLGVGEGYDDLIPFNPDWMIERIFE